MILVWIFTWILAAQNDPSALILWHWFGAHVFYTVLLFLFLA